MDPRYLRPIEVNELCGDASKARRILAWEPRTSSSDLVRLMLVDDLKAVGIEPPAAMSAATAVSEPQ